MKTMLQEEADRKPKFKKIDILLAIRQKYPEPLIDQMLTELINSIPTLENKRKRNYALELETWKKEVLE